MQQGMFVIIKGVNMIRKELEKNFNIRRSHGDCLQKYNLKQKILLVQKVAMRF